MHDGDMMVFIDMRIGIPPSDWSYVYSEAFYGAFAALFKVKASAVELLNDAGSEYTMGTKLHFQIRLKAKDYPGKPSLVKATESIPLVSLVVSKINDSSKFSHKPSSFLLTIPTSAESVALGLSLLAHPSSGGRV